ncbi:hypothetical protein CBR_g8053 [Chara braunii]|uniref:Myb-like domain-containing protein n=1 Tax=Chara braunii TaxID=69332 RepID=A0A388KL34_CHABU|nr:hypothetical protein CBR_g8053 [Chara braunii]|eukprot:GBG70755.1 hypothetical protein CBR_g8053 [Chara braunii]
MPAGVPRGGSKPQDMRVDGGFAVRDHPLSVQQQFDLYAARACEHGMTIGAGFGMPLAHTLAMPMGGRHWSPECSQGTRGLLGVRCSPSPPEGVDTDASWNRSSTRSVSPETRMDSPYDEGTGDSEAGGEDGHAEQGNVVPMVASSMGGQGDVHGRGVGGEAVGGRPAKGRPPAQKKSNVPWTLDERVKLAILMGEDDALMADANSQHRFKQRKNRYVWVNDRMKDVGFKQRTGEDCRKKWSNMLQTAKLIVEKCEAYGQPSNWDLSMEERKEKSPAFF